MSFNFRGGNSVRVKPGGRMDVQAFVLILIEMLIRVDGHGEAMTTANSESTTTTASRVDQRLLNSSLADTFNGKNKLNKYHLTTVSIRVF